MDKPIIEVKNIGKKYDIAHMRGGYVALRDVIANVFRNPFSFLAHKAKRAVGLEKKEEFWALRDVNFSVNRGEVVGVIGANGAGKSTLLKILSQITPPTEGEVILRGRVGSLLEVGTGFHPELTGRENIFLNGAILGMKKREIAAKFDEIVAFAGVDKFLDTPVKHYSSGMYVRLAFSVAAHMEPDILLVDEVLAVGDAEFQKKCLGKMDEITRKEGRTILFVSHNMGAIRNLCARTIVLENGQKKFDGDTKEAIEIYSQGLHSKQTKDLNNRTDRQGKGNVRFESVRFYDEAGQPINHVSSGQTFEIGLVYRSSKYQSLENCRLSILVKNSMENSLFLCSSELTSSKRLDLIPEGEMRCRIERLPLSKGEYPLTIFVESNGQTEDTIDNAATLIVEDGDFYGTGMLYPRGWKGNEVLLKHSWRQVIK